MAGLTFDDDTAVDADARLGSWLPGWTSATAARRSPNTVAAYLGDIATVAGAIAGTLGRTVPVLDPDDQPGPPAGRDGEPVAPRSTYARAEAALSALALRDTDPRLLTRALDVLAVGASPSSQRRALAAWSSFCEHLVRYGQLAANPAKHPSILSPSAPAPLPKPLTEVEVARLLQTVTVADADARAPWPARDLALAAVLLGTGARLEEIRGAAVGDYDELDTGWALRVTGKGSKTRIIPTQAETTEAVHRYLADRGERLGAPHVDDPLFVRSDGSTFSPRAMRSLVERWFLRAGIRRRPGAVVHALRHTFATLALDSGASVVEVQQLLGHQGLDTTRRYLAVVGDGLNQATAAHRVRALLAETLGPERTPQPPVRT